MHILELLLEQGVIEQVDMANFEDHSTQDLLDMGVDIFMIDYTEE